MIESNINIINYNFDYIKDDIKNKLKNKSEWKDIDLDNTIVDLFINILTYYLMLDVNAFNKMFLDSIPIVSGSERVLYEFANLVGYDINYYKSATGEVKFYLDNVNEYKTIIIPAGTEVASKNNLIYTTIEEATLNIGMREVSVSVIQGKKKKERYMTNYKENQFFKIYERVDKGSIVDNTFESIVVKVGNEVWERADDLLFVGYNEKKYVLKFFNDYFVVLFGNGRNGYIPDSYIEIEYYVTNGSLGNVSKNFIDNIVSNIYYSGGIEEVKGLKVKNESDFVNGSDRENLLSLRNNLKKYFSLNPYLWTKEEYENYLKSHEKCLGVKVYNGWELYPDDLTKYLKIYCFVILKNYEVLNNTIKEELNEYLNRRKLFNLQFVFYDAEYVEVLIYIYLKFKNRYFTSVEYNETTLGIKDIIKDLFDLGNITNRGGDVIRNVYESDIIYEIKRNYDNLERVYLKMQSKEKLFKVINQQGGSYIKDLAFNNIKPNGCYLYLNTDEIGYFDNNLLFIITNNNYSGKITASIINNNGKKRIEVIVNDNFEDKVFYLISNTNDSDDLILKGDFVCFSLKDEIIQFGLIND